MRVRGSVGEAHPSLVCMHACVCIYAQAHPSLVHVRRQLACAVQVRTRVERREGEETGAFSARQGRVADERPLARKLLRREDWRDAVLALAVCFCVTDQPPLTVASTPRGGRVISRALDDGVEGNLHTSRCVLGPVGVQWIRRVRRHCLRIREARDAAMRWPGIRAAHSRIDEDGLPIDDSG